jgi:hypothetical protein
VDAGDPDGNETPRSESQPWPLSLLDTSPQATRRRGLRLTHVVIAIMAGGVLTVATSVIVGAIVCGVILAISLRGRYTEVVESVDRLGGELSDVYARIEQANREIEDARRDSQDRQSRTPGPS